MTKRTWKCQIADEMKKNGLIKEDVHNRAIQEMGKSGDDNYQTNSIDREKLN